MKTIICGPAHSGKSVLLANLQRLMPQDSFQRITANGDGEGAWSNNPDQEEVSRVRVKTDNSPEEFALWTSLIRKASQDIVLIDIGSKLQDDKIPLFEASDSFVIVCSAEKQAEDPDIISKWKSFGEQHGCECIAIISTEQEGEEHMRQNKPVFTALATGLIRGHYHPDSVVIKELADVIITKSGYTPTINFWEIARRIGVSHNWTTTQGVYIGNYEIPKSKAPELYKLLHNEYDGIGKVKIEEGQGTVRDPTGDGSRTCPCATRRTSIYKGWQPSNIM